MQSSASSPWITSFGVCPLRSSPSSFATSICVLACAPLCQFEKTSWWHAWQLAGEIVGVSGIDVGEPVGGGIGAVVAVAGTGVAAEQAASPRSTAPVTIKSIGILFIVHSPCKIGFEVGASCMRRRSGFVLTKNKIRGGDRSFTFTNGINCALDVLSFVI